MYIGNPISIGNLSSQYLNGGASSYSLNHSVGSDPSILVAIDGVLQQPSVAYTVSGSTLTFPGGNTPSGTNNICVVYLSLPISLPTPGDGTVGISQLSASGSPSNSNFLRGDNTWATAGGPSLGSGNEIIRTNSDQINQNITIPSGTNGMSAAPITIGNSYTVTVNGTWTIVGA